MSLTTLSVQQLGCLAASREKQGGLWNDAKMMASYGASNPWQMTKATGSGLGQGLTNVGRGAKGLAETTAGGIGTGLTGIAAGGEAITDRMGITDPSFNTSWQAAKNMGEFTAGGAKNVGDVFGAGSTEALMGRAPDHVTRSHERMMDEAGYGDTAKTLTRGGLGVGRLAAEAIPYMVGPGMVGGAAKALNAGKGMSGVTRAGVQAAKNPRIWTGVGFETASDYTGNKPINPANPATQMPPTQAAGPSAQAQQPQPPQQLQQPQQPQWRRNLDKAFGEIDTYEEAERARAKKWNDERPTWPQGLSGLGKGGSDYAYLFNVVNHLRAIAREG